MSSRENTRPERSMSEVVTVGISEVYAMRMAGSAPDREEMARANRHARPKTIRNEIKKDILQFAIPGIIVLILELSFLVRDGLRGFWGQLWDLITHPANLLEMPGLMIAGMFMFVFGLTIMTWGQVTLFKNYSGTVVIREGHELITHGIYGYVRNPMYFGLLLAAFGLPAYALSLNAFLVSLLLVPIVLNRIRLEEGLLTEHFREEYLQYKASTKRLIPFVY